MSKKLDDLIRKLQALGANLQEFQAAALNKQAALAKQLNQEQLAEGRRADNSRLPAYSPKTIVIKTRLGQQTSPMNLRNKGDFWNSIKYEAVNGEFEGEATDRKTGLIMDAFGELIVGLTPKNKLKISRAANRDFVIDAKNFLHGQL